MEVVAGASRLPDVSGVGSVGSGQQRGEVDFTARHSFDIRVPTPSSTAPRRSAGQRELASKPALC